MAFSFLALSAHIHLHRQHTCRPTSHNNEVIGVELAYVTNTVVHSVCQCLLAAPCFVIHKVEFLLCPLSSFVPTSQRRLWERKLNSKRNAQEVVVSFPLLCSAGIYGVFEKKPEKRLPRRYSALPFHPLTSSHSHIFHSAVFSGFRVHTNMYVCKCAHTGDTDTSVAQCDWYRKWRWYGLQTIVWVQKLVQKLFYFFQSGF